MSGPPCPGPPCVAPPRPADGHKGTFGRVLVIGGSRGMSGAIALTALAALRSGSGIVSALVPDRCLESVAAHDPSLITVPGADTPRGQFSLAAVRQVRRALPGIDALAIGPGMGTGPGAVTLVRLVAADEQRPRVFDADALNIVARNQRLTLHGPAVLTPHPGEMQRLTGVSSRDRDAQRRAADDYARHHGVVLLLKGQRTYVTDGGQRWVNSTGCSAMATGGSGDVLTGVIASLLGQRMPPWQAACLGAYLHGLAGELAAAELGSAGVIASDIVRHLPAAFRSAGS